MQVDHSSLGFVGDEASHILILGSFPSVTSRRLGFYYAHPQNRFWKVMQALFKEEVLDHKVFSKQHHLAFYDVIESCEIHGSDDSSIKNVVPANIAGIIQQYPITCIVTTGKKAEQLYKKYQPDFHLPVIHLPSTSPANAKMRLDDLVEAYQIIMEYSDE